MNAWYKKKTPNGDYYTPFSKSKKRYAYAGTGDKTPTPKEMTDFLNGIDETQDYWTDNLGYITFESEEETKLEKVELPGGVYIYKGDTHQDPERLLEIPLRDETYVDVHGLTKEIKTDIDEFLSNESLYRETNIIYKIGFLMYGEPGNGKTSILRQLLRHKFPKDSVTIFLYGLPSTEFIGKLQETLKNRLKVIVFEELVTVINNMPLHIVLNFLDGEHSLDKSIVFATTNYPEKLPGNLVDRPSRFDKRYKLGNPKSVDRQVLLKLYLNREPTESEVLVTKGQSVAAIKEIGLMVRIKKMSVEDAVKKMKTYSEIVKKEFGEQRELGIRSSSPDSD